MAEVAPGLVGRNPNGEAESVRYDQVNAMLLNEFLKEHRAFVEEHRKVNDQGRELQEQGATIIELRKEIQALVAHAKQQDQRIERVSAQVQSATGAQLVVSVP